MGRMEQEEREEGGMTDEGDKHVTGDGGAQLCTAHFGMATLQLAAANLQQQQRQCYPDD